MLKPNFLFAFTVFFLSAMPGLLFSQDYGDQYLSLNGAVKNRETDQGIPFANIAIKDQPIGINTNEEGSFQLNIEKEYLRDTLVVSCIGYKSKQFVIEDFLKRNGQVIYLKDTTYELTNILITSIPAKEIVQRALNNIPKNYPEKPYMLQGFYRTAFRENDRYVRLLEAALNIYDEGFGTKDGISTEFIKLRKSIDYRKFRWTEGANYLASFIAGDFVRNQDGSIRDLFGRWDFAVTGITYQDNDEVFVITGYIPTKDNHENYQCQLFIRIKDYAILQLNYDYAWDPKYFPGVRADSADFKRTNVHVKTFYREYRKKLYLSYQYREAKWNIYNMARPKETASVMEIHDELLVHKVKANHKKQPDEKINEYGDIYKKVNSYDKRFWKRYNKPVDTELYRSIKADLEKEEPLAKQFREEKMEDLYR